MSTQQAMRNVDRELEDGLGAVLEKNLNVVAMKKQPTVSKYDAPNPEEDMNQIAAVHRQSIMKRTQRISDTKKGLKATLASIAMARKEEKARHDAVLADLVEREAEAKAQASIDIDRDQKVVASNEAALKILTAE